MNNQEHEQLLRFHTELRQQVLTAIEAGEEGGFQEEQFTQTALDLLSANGDTENARECRDCKLDSAGRTMHKINGYALSEDAENLDLFISIFKGRDQPQRLASEEVNRAFNQCRRFLNNAFKGYWQDMDESTAAFDFAREVCHNRSNLVRANLFLLTDGECNVEVPGNDYLEKTNLLLTYRIVDLHYLFRLEKGQPDPIVIDFEESTGQGLPCLPIPSQNDKYQTFLAIIPGNLLSDIYEKYGSRLLEMNVRSFLQFNGKTNKGIRETILREPHMFLAYNNGIAATAESVELTSDGNGIRSVREFQIVNGGQTTASIFHTRRKDKADVSQLFVQMKLSVIKTKDNLSDIINNISRCANSQNKISDADLSANSPFQIQIEKLSRLIWAPQQPGRSHQTRWFYERARAQYKNELAREFTQARKKAFELQNPRKQMFVKEELAKFINAWSQLPHFVVQGNQKNYSRFTTALKKSEQRPDNVFFEDAVAKAILFRTAEELYGRKPNAIGDMRYITVPYSIAWLSYVTNGRLDLFKIWKRQSLSIELRDLLYKLMQCVETFIKEEAPGALYGEWAKKEDCWKAVSRQTFEIALIIPSGDLVDSVQPLNRYRLSEQDAERLMNEATEQRLRSVPAAIWKSVEEWGYATGQLTMRQRDLVHNLFKAASTGRKFYENELHNGAELLELLLDQAPHLFIQTDCDFQESSAADTPVSRGNEITLDIVRQLVVWDRRNKRLLPHEFIYMRELAEEKRPLSVHNKDIVQKNIRRLKTFGFTIQ